MAGTINKPKKPKSKRTPVRLRHRIEKASAGKQRKARKLAKKSTEWRSKHKKDPGIPNSYPYKGQILEEIEQARIIKLEATQKRRTLARAARTGSVVLDDGEEQRNDSEDAEGGIPSDHEMVDADASDGGGDESNPMAALLASARVAAERYERELASGAEEDHDDERSLGQSDGHDVSDWDEAEAIGGKASSSRKAYDKMFKEVVDRADVVLYVLDARNPEGTRSRDVEHSVMAAASGGKRLILILNKIDLIPPTVLRGWLAHLRRSFPTLPLRAASQTASGAATFSHGDLTPQHTADVLVRALKAFAASRGLRRAISVGVVGFPNVGKSSVVNALLSRVGGGSSRANARSAKTCPAGAEAGVTTSIRAVKFDGRLTLLDSPGIVFPSSSAQSSGSLVSVKTAAEAHANLVLLNVVPLKQIEDPTSAVTLLLRRLSASPDLMSRLADTYSLPPLLPSAGGDITTDFLVQVARRRGRLGRGGVPNINAAAMTVLSDWRDGRIQGWVEPPVGPGLTSVGDPVGSLDGSVPDQKEIVTEWAAEFEIEGLWGGGSLTS